MRCAYADPPYLGRGKADYGKHHPNASVWDLLSTHQSLIERLCDEFPEGWALSLHVPSLRLIAPLCPADSRVAAWVKPWAIFKPGVNPGYCWEPVIWRGGRGFQARGGKRAPTVRDWVSCNILQGSGLKGAKPRKFCFWIFDLLGLWPGDELVDLFPGTEAVGRAWEAYCTGHRQAEFW